MSTSNFLIKDKTKAIDTIKIAPFRKEIRKTKPHKHNKYLELVYFSRGSGCHTIDNQKIAVKPATFFVVRKEQVHFWDLEKEPEGFVIIIKKKFVENSLDKELKRLITIISAHPYLYLKEKETVEQLFHLLVKEYSKNSTENVMFIEGLIKALLAKLLVLENVEKSKDTSFFYKFLDLLNEQKTLKNNIEYYASLLNTTPQNLNASCKKECEKTASEVLSEYLISEAKRLLIYTDLTIVEISLALSFKDNSHFTKYFKRYTHTTPSKYRSEMN